MAKRTAREPRPVQVFLDTRRFISLEEPRPAGGAKKDFYAGNDRGFATQKTRIRRRLQGASAALIGGDAPAGFIRVQMREDALAKSYRPLGSLFTEPHGFALVGADRVGEVLFQATPQALNRLDRLIDERAEASPRLVPNKITGVLEPRVSGYRSEVGAIAEIDLVQKRDRVPFGAEEAVAWLRQPGVIGGYVVELFRPKAEVSPAAIAQMIKQFADSLANLSIGLVARSFLPAEATSQFGEPTLAISIQLYRDSSMKEIVLPFASEGRTLFVDDSLRSSAIGRERDLSIENHRALLEVLAEQALVRHVDLPPLIEAAPAARSAEAECPPFPKPVKGVSYPVVGIIDGGISALPQLLPWRVDDAGIVPANDRDETHGTFIAGLVVGGTTLNPHLVGQLEPRGCKFYDLDLFPRRELRQAYYGDDADYFFDLLDEKIKVAKADHKVRVFNFSFGLSRYTIRGGYSPWADRLDRIARVNDVILVISAGNLQPGQTRPPWPANVGDAVAMLAAQTGSQQIVAPAEHLLGLTVGAINPPGIRGHEVGLPTTYTRRGPGIGGSRKPDLAQFGGAESGAAGGNRTGLISLSPDGGAMENCGTSFSAPSAAATVATLDHRLEQGQPRELLLALPIHRAQRGKILSHPTLRHIARDFVGFGLPPIADQLLVDDPYAISLVFTEKLLRRQRLEFPFSWPAELGTDDGACRGRIDLTLAYTPPIDAAHKDEAQRVQLEAHLFQEATNSDGEIEWGSQLTQDGSGVPQGMNKTELYLLRTGLKWSPIKRYSANMPQGRGKSSNWKLTLDSQIRAAATYPNDGVPFALIMTISDPKGGAPIHDSIRNSLQTQGLAIADILVAHRVRSRRG
jgi:hypothetical protein